MERNSCHHAPSVPQLSQVRGGDMGVTGMRSRPPVQPSVRPVLPYMGDERKIPTCCQAHDSCFHSKGLKIELRINHPNHPSDTVQKSPSLRRPPSVYCVTGLTGTDPGEHSTEPIPAAVSYQLPLIFGHGPLLCTLSSLFPPVWHIAVTEESK